MKMNFFATPLSRICSWRQVQNNKNIKEFILSVITLP